VLATLVRIRVNSALPKQKIKLWKQENVTRSLKLINVKLTPLKWFNSYMQNFPRISQSQIRIDWMIIVDSRRCGNDFLTFYFRRLQTSTLFADEIGDATSRNLLQKPVRTVRSSPIHNLKSNRPVILKISNLYFVFLHKSVRSKDARKKCK
jgi:hypothetical protein